MKIETAKTEVKLSHIKNSLSGKICLNIILSFHTEKHFDKDTPITSQISLLSQLHCD